MIRPLYPNLTFLLSLANLAGLATAQLQVTATAPVRYSAIQPMQAISVTFSQAIQPASLNSLSFAVFGQWSGAARGDLSLTNGQRTAVFQPRFPLAVGEMVTVTLSNALAGTTGQSLVGGYYLPLSVASAPGSRQFAAAQTIPLRLPGEGLIGTYGIYAGDINRDGAPDITALNEIGSNVRVLLNSGCGTFGPLATISNPGQQPSPHEGADFNRDGWLDLVTGNQNGSTISVYLNDGSGRYGAPTIYIIGGYVHGLACADFTGDGAWDIAATSTFDVAILRNNGNGTFSPAGNFGAGSNEDNVYAVDANGDGRVDLSVGNFAPTMGLLLGQGNGTFVAGPTQNTGGLAFHQAVGDLNGDHHVDLAFANRGTNTLAILLGAGNGNFAPPVTYPVGLNPAAVDLGDLDGDGDLDAAVSNYGSGNYTVLWNRGDGVFDQLLTLPGVQSGSCCTLVDFNRDGVLDIIAADETADVALLFRQSLTASPTAEIPGCAAALRINGRADRAGFGTRAPAPLQLGSIAAMNISGPDNATCLLGLGLPLDPGAPNAAGILNINLGGPFALLVSQLDQRGEAILYLTVPANLPPGLRFAGQAVVIGAETRFANPQGCVLVR